jgi:hypothetical protein
MRFPPVARDLFHNKKVDALLAVELVDCGDIKVVQSTEANLRRRRLRALKQLDQMLAAEGQAGRSDFSPDVVSNVSDPTPTHFFSRFYDQRGDLYAWDFIDVRL